MSWRGGITGQEGGSGGTPRVADEHSRVIEGEQVQLPLLVRTDLESELQARQLDGIDTETGAGALLLLLLLLGACGL